jgi:hypothetical protein
LILENSDLIKLIVVLTERSLVFLEKYNNKPDPDFYNHTDLSIRMIKMFTLNEVLNGSSTLYMDNLDSSC